jgi:hypothetical protein
MRSARQPFDIVARRKVYYLASATLPGAGLRRSARPIFLIIRRAGNATAGE